MSSAPIYLTIADFILQLNSVDGHAIKLDSGFAHFYAGKESIQKIDLTLNCFSTIPENLKNPLVSLYKANVAGGKLWEIYKHDEGLQLMVYDPDNPGVLQQIALYNEHKQIWQIYTEKTQINNEEVVFPLKYPLAPLVMYYLTVKNDAIMIHASGIYDGKKGRIFSGFSGVGKSTMAKLWNEKSSMVVNDDRLILRKIKGAYWMFNTPMDYTDDYKKTPVNHIYFPYHHSENKYERLKGVEAIAQMMAFCIQHGYSTKNMSAHFEFIAALSQKIPLSKIGVVPTLEVVDFIKEQDAKLD